MSTHTIGLAGQIRVLEHANHPLFRALMCWPHSCNSRDVYATAITFEEKKKTWRKTTLSKRHFVHTFQNWIEVGMMPFGFPNDTFYPIYTIKNTKTVIRGNCLNLIVLVVTLETLCHITITTILLPRLWFHNISTILNACLTSYTKWQYPIYLTWRVADTLFLSCLDLCQIY